MPSLIGNKPNQVPTNGDLGTLAFQDASNPKVGALVADGLTVDTTTLVVDATNNRVGVGTASPATTLAVQGTFSVGNGVSGSINYASTGALTIGSTAAEPLVFRTNSSERMRIDSLGRFGAGVTPSNWDTTQFTSFDMGGSTGAAISSDSRIFLSGNLYNNGSGWIYKTTGYTGLLQVNDSATGNYIWYTAPVGTAGGTSSLTQRMKLWLSGGLSLGNNTDPGANNLSVTGTGKFGITVGVGAATPSASGAGITFPATQSASADANTLDDYEEGTWTPTGNGISFAAGTTGKYTKIGNLVTLTFTVVFPTTANTSNAYITAMPFTVGVNSAAAIAGYTSGVNLETTTGNTYMLFLNTTNTAFITNATLSAQTVVGTIVYQV